MTTKQKKEKPYQRSTVKNKKGHSRNKTWD